MSRLPTAVAALAAIVSFQANAAELTRLASSFEDDDPFSMFLDIGLERSQLRSRIDRENHQDGAVVDRPELRYVNIDTRLNLDLRLGLWRDLEFRYAVPVVFQQNHAWRYTRGADETNSTLTSNCMRPDGTLTNPACPSTGAGAVPLAQIPGNTFRGGLGNMTFGLAYAFFNQRKDDTKPTWIVGLDYEAPTADLRDPAAPTSTDERGGVGDRVHKYTFYTSFSKRMGVADPYFRVHYTIPSRGPGWYSNCDHRDPDRLSSLEGCDDPFSREETGIDAPHRAGVIFGSELNAYEAPNGKEKVALDFRGIANYVSKGRYDNDLSDLFGKLLYTQDYLQVGGTLGFIAHAADYLHLKATATLLFNTDHLLTGEPAGKDLDGSGEVEMTNPREVSPTYDHRIDTVSRRFRATESQLFAINLTASFLF